MRTSKGRAALVLAILAVGGAASASAVSAKTPRGKTAPPVEAGPPREAPLPAGGRPSADDHTGAARARPGADAPTAVHGRPFGGGGSTGTPGPPPGSPPLGGDPNSGLGRTAGGSPGTGGDSLGGSAGSPLPSGAPAIQGRSPEQAPAGQSSPRAPNPAAGSPAGAGGQTLSGRQSAGPQTRFDSRRGAADEARLGRDVFRYTRTFGALAAPLTLFSTAGDRSPASRPLLPAKGAVHTDVAQLGSDWTPERDTSARGRDAPETLLYFLAALMALVGGVALAGGKVLKRPAGPVAAPPGVRSSGRPVLFLDVDGVVALSEACDDAPPGHPYLLTFGFVWVPDACRSLMGRLEERFELVWATGWEDRANLELPLLLGLSGDLHALSFGKKARYGSSEWKIPEVERYAGNRPVAWIDDNLDHHHEDWARKRSAPTLLIKTDSATGMAQQHVDRLLRWGERFAPELTTSGWQRELVTGRA
jgi:hypothetical protein